MDKGNLSSSEKMQALRELRAHADDDDPEDRDYSSENSERDDSDSSASAILPVRTTRQPQIDKNPTLASVEDDVTRYKTIPTELARSFKTLLELKAAIETYSIKTYQPFSKTDGVVKLEPPNDVLYYQNVSFRCACYGSTHTQVTDASRKKIGYTKKTFCKARINVYQRDGKLHVGSVCLQHFGHDLDKDSFYAAWPALRQPPMQYVQDSMELGAAPKKIAQNVRTKLNLPATYDDVYNVQRRLPATKAARLALQTISVENRLLDVCTKWQMLEKVQFARSYTNDNNLAVIAWVMPEMLAAWKKFHEVLFIDSTYRLNTEGYSLLNVLTLSEHGHGYPVGQAFLMSESAEVVESALSKIASSLEDANYEETRIVYTDRDWSQLAVFKKLIPNAKIYLCTWHVDQTFWLYTRSLSEKTRGTQWKLLMYVMCKKLVRAPTYEKFAEVWNGLQHLAGDDGEKVIASINKNWMNCKEQWAHYTRAGDVNYFKHTNMVNERFNRQTKEIGLGPKATRGERQQLPEVLDVILAGLKDMLEGRRLVYAYRESKRPVLIGHPVENVLTKLAPLVHTGAFQAVMQHSNKRSVEKQLLLETADSSVLVVDSGRAGKTYVLDMLEGTCSCSWQRAFTLPCVHALKVFAANEASVEIMQRFVDGHFLRNAPESDLLVCLTPRIDIDSEDDLDTLGDDIETLERVVTQKHTMRTFEQKWGRVKPIAMEVTNVICGMEGEQFDNACSQLRKLLADLTLVLTGSSTIQQQQVPEVENNSPMEVTIAQQNASGPVRQNPGPSSVVREAANFIVRRQTKLRGRPKGTQQRNIDFDSANNYLALLSQADDGDGIEDPDLRSDDPIPHDDMPLPTNENTGDDDHNADLYGPGDVAVYRFSDNTTIYQRDLDRISAQGWLYFGIIDIASKILREMSTLEVQTKGKSLTTGFLPIRMTQSYYGVMGEYSGENFTTILHDSDHYQVLHHNPNRKQQQTWLLCSLGILPTLDTQRQIMKLVGKLGCDLTVHIVPVPKQPSGTECGYFSVMFAAILKAGKIPRQIKIDSANQAPSKFLSQLLLTRQMPKIPTVRGKPVPLTEPSADAIIIHWADVGKDVEERMNQQGPQQTGAILLDN